jgi:hypothetical protein
MTPESKWAIPYERIATFRTNPGEQIGKSGRRRQERSGDPVTQLYATNAEKSSPDQARKLERIEK